MAYYALPQHTIDGMDHGAYLEVAHVAAEKASKNKGRLIHDHPAPADLISGFMASDLMSNPQHASVRPGSCANVIYTPPLPAPYPPCTSPLKDLRPITISDMRLETNHRGCSVMLRVLTPTGGLTALVAVVEDKRETAVMLQLYHQAEESVVPARELLRSGVCVVKEPFLTCATNGSYSVRVEHVSDIVWLENGDDSIPHKWRRPESATISDSTGIRKQGNEAVKHERWAEAELLYSSAIRVAETKEEEQLAYLNRSYANLRLQRPEKALSDALRSSDATSPSEKGIFREARALYELGEFETALNKLQKLVESYPGNIAAATEMERAKARLREQQTGSYDFRRMYQQAEKTPPLIDCATFSSPVEVRDSPGKGRGVYTTMPVSAGQLLLCEKALGYRCAEHGSGYNLLMDVKTKKLDPQERLRLVAQLVQKLYHGYRHSHEFKKLYCGDYTTTPVSEVDGIPVVDSFLVNKIVDLNACNGPRISRERMHHALHGDASATEKWEHPQTTCGVWLLASRLNHSCTPNCRGSFIGDMQIVRATMDIPAGAELLTWYRDPEPLQSYTDVQGFLKKWGFQCECGLCKDRKATPEKDLARRAALDQRLTDVMKGGLHRACSGETALVITQMEETYPLASETYIRLELAVPYVALGTISLAVGLLEEGVNMTVYGLEALGFVIRVQLFGTKRKKPRLEVERWGLPTETVYYAFTRLSEFEGLDPRLRGRAKHYAQIAYSMVVGESEATIDIN